MSVVLLVIDGVLLLGIVGVSLYGSAHLPAGARLPLHFGPAGYTNWQPKNVALVLWPAIAVGVCVITIVTRHGRHNGPLTFPVVLTIILALVLLSYLGALRAALSRSGSGSGSSPDIT
jgi:hypothetical protein